MRSEGLNKTPRLGQRLGFLYPIAHKLLETHRFWSPSRWLPHSAFATDCYIVTFWIIESIIIYLFSTCNNFTILWIAISITIFRFLDLMFVLSSILVKGFYKRQDWASAHRVTLLVTCNAIELMILFAILYFGFNILTPDIAHTHPPIYNFFDALYFSVITGTSIGYGIPHPIGWLSKVLSMLEGSSIVLVVIAVIGYIANEKSKEIKKSIDLNE